MSRTTLNTVATCAAPPASDEARRARAEAYLADAGKRIEALADEIEGKIVENGSVTGHYGPMKDCITHLRSAADALGVQP